MIKFYFNKLQGCILIFLLLFASALTLVQGAYAENGTEINKMRIPWEMIEGSIRYEVVIKDSSGAEVLNTSVTTTFIEFSLPQGKYRIRITPINKFNKAGTPSDWETFEVAELPPSLKIRSKTVFKLSAGVPYSMPGSPWNSKLNNSYQGVTLNLGIYNTLGFFRFAGFEIEGRAVQFPGKENTSSLSNFSIGGNIFFTSGFDFPLNVILRGGGGITASRLLYTSNINGKESLLWSSFPYIKAGASLEWYIYRNLFLEGGADYSITRFKGEPLKTTSFFLRAGCRLKWTPVELSGEAEEQSMGSSAFPLLFHLSAGPLMVQMSPGIDNISGRTFIGAMANLGITGRHGFSRYVGFEADTSWARFDGSGIMRSLTWSLTGGGIVLRTAFSFPVNLLARFGGGIAVSGLEYTDPLAGSMTLWSEKPYYRAGGALELVYYKGLFIELGGDYLAGLMTYDGSDINAMRYFVRAGVKI